MGTGYPTPRRKSGETLRAESFPHLHEGFYELRIYPGVFFVLCATLL